MLYCHIYKWIRTIIVAIGTALIKPRVWARSFTRLEERERGPGGVEGDSTDHARSIWDGPQNGT